MPENQLTQNHNLNISFDEQHYVMKNIKKHPRN